MKMVKFTMACLIALLFSACGLFDGNGTGKEETEIEENTLDKKEFSQEGIYLGLLGFNDVLTGRAVSYLDNNSLNASKSFVNNTLSLDNGTILFHAVNSAIDSVRSIDFPENLENVSIITITDGLDQGSYSLNDSLNSGREYLEHISERLEDEFVQGVDITSYAIGIRGNDVQDTVKFYADLTGIASNDTTVFEVGEISEVNEVFSQIAQSLTSVNQSVKVSIVLPAQEPGYTQCFTFDTTSNPETANYTVSGEWKNSNNKVTLENLKTKGISVSSVSITELGTKYKITFHDFSFLSNDMDSKQLIKGDINHWHKPESGSIWQKNSEFDPANNTETTVEKSSAAIMLVLDCSKSMGSYGFSQMKSTVNQFITKIYNDYNGTSETVIDDNPVIVKIPSNPTGVVASDGTYEGRVVISFNPVSTADTYYIYRANSSSGTYFLIDSTSYTSYSDYVTSSGSDNKYFYKVKAKNSAGVSSFSSYNSGYAKVSGPSAEVSDVWVEHDYYHNGVKGMMIHTKFDVDHALGEEGDIVHWFYYQNGDKILDVDGSFKTVDGQVSTSGTFTPGYENTVYYDYKVFIPVAQIHTPSGQYEIKFTTGVFVNDVLLERYENDYDQNVIITR